MKANSLEELVTNSNIAGELRNHTDWHTRLVKFAQLVADWQASQMPLPEDTVLFNKGVKEGRRLEREDMLAKAVEGEYSAKFLGRTIYLRIPLDGFKPGDKVKLYVFKED